MGITGYVTYALADTQPQARRSESVTRTESAYPTGDKTTSVVLLERFTPTEVRVGQGFSYKVRLTNLTSATIEELVLTEQLPPGIQVGAIMPEPASREGNEATWTWPKLGARETKEIRISGSSAQQKDLIFCATVTFETVACATMRVVQPELALVKSAPPEVLLCDPIPLQFVVTNRGTGVARNVRITDTLPEGWTTTDGKRALAFEAGDLAAGQSRQFSASVQASQTGEFNNIAKVTEDSGLSAESRATTVVRKPELVVSKSGPEFRYIGRPAEFKITVKNTGDTVAQDTTLVDTIPAATQFSAASDGGRFADGKITWNLGDIAAGASKTVSLTLKPTQRGVIQNRAVAQAVCAEGRASATMEVRGIPAILLEVIDLHDPIEVGNNETYEIVVVNQGSADGTNIAITCTIPPEQDYVSSDGPTRAQVDGKTIRFALLPSLAPKAKATYRLVVKGTKAADVRFKVSILSDQIKTPVEETESTHIY
jgi:uncharacterized repeat protein (TIGR01451 family)